MINIQSSKTTALDKFDQEEHKGNALQAFQEFLDSYVYEYDSISKDPPEDLDAVARTAFIRKLLQRLTKRHCVQAEEGRCTQ